MSLRIVFMGSPDFALPSLTALRAAGHRIVCVYSQPPRPAGRGQKPCPCPVLAYAQEEGLPTRSPHNFKDPKEEDFFNELKAEIAVVAAYGLLLPETIFATPSRGSVNVHASLLPRWRGAAPIHRAIMAGDRETGVTIMRVGKELDAGPMLLAESCPIGPTDRVSDLHDRLARMGGRLIVKALAGLQAGTVSETPQPTEGVTYAPKISKAECRLDWRKGAGELDRQVRGLSSHPGAFFETTDSRIKVLAAEFARTGNSPHAPGTVLDDRLSTACANGWLRPTLVQRAGKGIMETETFLRGHPIKAGTRLS